MTNNALTTTHPSNTTRGRPSTFSMDELAEIEKEIDAAPVPTKPLKASAALSLLAPALRKARDRGHSLSGLAQLCVQQGLHVSERAISRAISQTRASKSTKKKPAGGFQSST